MFCGKCGVRLPDDAVKCDRCGAPVRIRPARVKKQEQAEKGAASKQKSVHQNEKEKEIQEPVQDPVFFEDAGDKVDVRSILKIARGEEAEFEEDSGNRPEEAESAAAGKAAQSSRETRKKQGNSLSGTGAVQRTQMSREAYLASLPVKEKIRRRISEALHSREEAEEARRMRSHMMRAAKHYGVELSEKDLQAPQPARSDRTESHVVIEEQVSRERAEKVRARLEERQASAPGKTAAETAAAKADAVKEAAAEKAEAQKAAKAEVTERVATDKASKAEAAAAEKAAAEKAAAERAAIEKAAAEAAAEKAAKAAAEKKAAAERAAIEKAAAEAAAEEAAKAKAAAAEKAAAESAAREKAAAEAAAEKAAKAAAEKKAAAERAAIEKAAEEAAKAEAAAAEKAAIEKAAADAAAEEAAKAEAAAAERAAAEEAATAEIAAESLRREQMEEFRRQQEYNARVLQRYREDAPDQVDRMLGRYGLSKEATVRLATLFLIAVLSVIYVMGRNKQPDLIDVPVAGEGMTGSPAVTDTGSGTGGEEETGDSENSVENEAETPEP